MRQSSYSETAIRTAGITEPTAHNSASIAKSAASARPHCRRIVRTKEYVKCWKPNLATDTFG
jgi:hypothetical protein